MRILDATIIHVHLDESSGCKFWMKLLFMISRMKIMNEIWIKPWLTIWVVAR
jgi:hypothetical protein